MEEIFKPLDSLLQDITAPIEYHESNFVLGHTLPDSRELSYTSEISGQAVKGVVQVGAVGSYKRIKAAPTELPDGVLKDDFFDWQVDNGYVLTIWNEKSCKRENLLTFYAF